MQTRNYLLISATILGAGFASWLLSRATEQGVLPTEPTPIVTEKRTSDGQKKPANVLTDPYKETKPLEDIVDEPIDTNHLYVRVIYDGQPLRGVQLQAWKPPPGAQRHDTFTWDPQKEAYKHNGVPFETYDIHAYFNGVHNNMPALLHATTEISFTKGKIYQVTIKTEHPKNVRVLDERGNDVNASITLTSNDVLTFRNKEIKLNKTQQPLEVLLTNGRYFAEIPPFDYFTRLRQYYQELPDELVFNLERLQAITGQVVRMPSGVGLEQATVYVVGERAQPLFGAKIITSDGGYFALSGLPLKDRQFEGPNGPQLNLVIEHSERDGYREAVPIVNNELGRIEVYKGLDVTVIVTDQDGNRYEEPKQITLEPYVLVDGVTKVVPRGRLPIADRILPTPGGKTSPGTFLEKLTKNGITANGEVQFEKVIPASYFVSVAMPEFAAPFSSFHHLEDILTDGTITVEIPKRVTVRGEVTHIYKNETGQEVRTPVKNAQLIFNRDGVMSQKVSFMGHGDEYSLDVWAGTYKVHLSNLPGMMALGLQTVTVPNRIEPYRKDFVIESKFFDMKVVDEQGHGVSPVILSYRYRGKDGQETGSNIQPVPNTDGVYRIHIPIESELIMLGGHGRGSEYKDYKRTKYIEDQLPGLINGGVFEVILQKR